MTTDFAELLRQQIEPLSFVGKLSGLVRPLTISEETETGKRRKTFPVACNVTAAECTNLSKLKDLCQDSSKKSVIYFEENGGTQFVGFEKNDFQYRANLRLVAWLNLAKNGIEDCSWSAVAALQIIKAITAIQQPKGYFNAGGKYTRCRITSISQTDKSAALFSKYTYDEAINQYLLYPFDYFALNIQIEFVVPASCIDSLIPVDPINCPDT